MGFPLPEEKEKDDADLTKRKTEEAAAQEGADVTSDSDVEDLDDDCPYNSDDEPGTVYSNLAAWYEQRVRERHARNPWLKYDSAADILERHGKYSAFYNRQQQEEEDSLADGTTVVAPQAVAPSDREPAPIEID